MEFLVTSEKPEESYDYFFYPTMCHVCKKLDGVVSLRRCSGCRMILYCGEQHQREHWPKHKDLCEAVRSVRQEYQEDDLEWNPEYFYDDPWQREDDEIIPKDAPKKEKKKTLIELVAAKLERPLELFEIEMFRFQKKCDFCKQTFARLQTCEKCAASFCENHKYDHMHSSCTILELCLRFDMLLFNKEEESKFPLEQYTKHGFEMDLCKDIYEFIKAYGNINESSEYVNNIILAKHSQYLTCPLTVLHGMRLLGFNPSRKDLVIHVVAANTVDKMSAMAWELFFHIIKKTLKSLTVVMVGRGLEESNKSLQLRVCDECRSWNKKLVLKFYDKLYEEYALDYEFMVPDIIVGYDTRVYVSKDYPSYAIPGISDMTIELIEEQDCPFILTSYTEDHAEIAADKIIEILGRDVDNAYSGKNRFCGLRPYRNHETPERMFYRNFYLTVYSSISQF